jgi:FkbM family methyltransferase
MPAGWLKDRASMNTISIADALGLAVKAFQARKTAEVERLCRGILSVVPGEPQALELLAETFMATGRPADAVNCYRQIVPRLHKKLATTDSQYGLKVLHGLGWRPGGILDVGAYQGEWAQIAGAFFPQAHIAMFEAQAGMEPKLRGVAAGRPGKFDVHIVLLGAENRDEAIFFQMNVNPPTGSSLYEEQTGFPRTVRHLAMRRLDDVASTERKFELLKLDVQGAELDVLSGARRLLSGIEVVFMELSFAEYNKGAPLAATAVAAMKDYGFRLFDIYPLARDRSGVLLQADAIFLHNGSRLCPSPPFEPVFS